MAIELEQVFRLALEFDPADRLDTTRLADICLLDGILKKDDR
jgi:hypothetical protein